MSSFQWSDDGEPEYLVLKNGVGVKVITIETPRTVDELAVADRAMTVVANEDRLIRPFKPEIYNDAGSGGAIT